MSAAPRLLGIESSCDETAAAVVEAPRRVLSSVVASQHELHERYGGVVPEIASRAHLERILPVVRAALDEAGVGLGDLDAVAVGHRPGLVGSLLVGASAAKALAWALDVPLIGVDHVTAHLGAAELDDEPLRLPALGLVVSGGHTSLLLVRAWDDIEPLGRTIDDAAGEAFDKAATILRLGYPGGPAVDRASDGGDEHAHDLPVAALGADRLDFSFSGLKTSLLYRVCGRPEGRGAAARLPRDASSLTARQRADYAASFQRAVVAALLRAIERALDRHEVATVVVGGGVSANRRLRAALAELAGRRGVDVRLPALDHCVDNAAMIAGLAARRLAAGEHDDWTLSVSTQSVHAARG